MTIYEPLSVGEIFDRALTIVVTRWRLLLPLALLLGASDTLANAAADVGANGWLIGAADVTSIAVNVVLFNGMVAIAGDIDGGDDLGSLLRLGLMRFWPAAGVVVFYCIALIAIIFISFIPSSVLRTHEAGVAGAAYIGGIGIAIVAGSFATLYAYVACVYVVLESMSPMGAIRAVTHRIKSAGAGRALCLGAALVVLTFVPTFSAALIPDRPPLLLACKLAVMFALLTPIFVYATAAQTVAALDYRNRGLGADLGRIVDERARA